MGGCQSISRLHWNNIQSPNKKASWDLNQEPSCCDVTVLTTTPPCTPISHSIHFIISFIHRSIFYANLIQFRVRGLLEPIPAVIGWEAGYTLDRSPVHHRDTEQTRLKKKPAHSDSLQGSIWRHQLTYHACFWMVGGSWREPTHSLGRTYKLPTERLIEWGLNQHQVISLNLIFNFFAK